MERDGLRLSSTLPKIQWDSNPHCPYGYSTMGNPYLHTTVTISTHLHILFSGHRTCPMDGGQETCQQTSTCLSYSEWIAFSIGMLFFSWRVIGKHLFIYSVFRGQASAKYGCHLQIDQLTSVGHFFYHEKTNKQKQKQKLCLLSSVQ